MELTDRRASSAAVTRFHWRMLTQPLPLSLIITFTWRIFIAAVGVGTHYLFHAKPGQGYSLIRNAHWPATPFNIIVDSSYKSDSLYYASIARHGYHYSTTHFSSMAFYPLYPLLMKGFAPVVGSLPTAGTVISTVCLFVSIRLLYIWMRARGLENRAPIATALLLLFPFSFFFVAVYTESLFLLLTLSTFVCLDRRQWGRTGAAAFLATLTHSTGLLLVPVILMFVVRERVRDKRVLLAFLGAPLGLALFGAYQAVVFGTPFASLRAQAPWHRNVHQALMDITLHSPVVRGQITTPRWWLVFLLVIGLLYLIAVPYVWRVCGPASALYVALSVLVPASVGLMSLERFVIVLFPVPVAIATFDHRKILATWLMVATYVSGFFAMGFAAGWPLV